MFIESLTQEQRLQLLRELMENPSQDETSLIFDFKEKFDEVEAGKMAAEIANRRNDPTRHSAGVIGKKLI